MEIECNSTWVTRLRDNVKKQPDNAVFTFLPEGDASEKTVTFQELDQKVRSVAAKLLEVVQPGQRALLLYHQGVDFIEAFYGCLYAGVIAVPLYSPQNQRKLSMIKTILEDSEADVILSTSQITTVVESKIESMPELKNAHWIETDTIDIELAEKWQEPSLDKETIGYLQYTSGSTSTPKGVIIDHYNALEQCEEMCVSWKIDEKSVLVSWLPHFHDLGMLFGILTPVYKGIHCIIMSPASFIKQPIRWLKAISDYKGTHSAAPNFAFDHCVDSITDEQRKALDLSSWKTVANGAEPVRKNSIERFYTTFSPQGYSKNTMCPAYGLAEATLKVTSCDVDEYPNYESIQDESKPSGEGGGEPRHLVSCGRAILDTKIKIVDPGMFTEKAEGQVGEIWVSSPCVARGYWNRPEETKTTFQAYLADTKEGPFLRTGDLGFVKQDDMYVTGRIKDLIVIRGSNHYPQDIEQTVEQSHPLLRSGYGAAFPVEVDGEERLVVAVERKRYFPHEFAVEDVIRAICNAISREHNLEVYGVLLLKTGSIHKTSSGKIQRQACRQSYLNNQLNVIGQWHDNSYKKEDSMKETVTESASVSDSLSGFLKQSVSEKIIAIVAKNVDTSIDEIDIKQSLSHYGLSSVNTFEVLDDIEKWLGYEIPPEWVWDLPSIEALIEKVAESVAISKNIPVAKVG